MSENIHIKRRQKKRQRPLLTTRNIITLIVLSAGVYAAFRFWVGNPAEHICGGDCESTFSLTAWVLAFFIMIGAVILAGAVIGTLVSVLRRRRSRSGFEALMQKEHEQKDSGEQGE